MNERKGNRAGMFERFLASEVTRKLRDQTEGMIGMRWGISGGNWRISDRILRGCWGDFAMNEKISACSFFFWSKMKFFWEELQVKLRGILLNAENSFSQLEVRDHCTIQCCSTILHAKRTERIFSQQRRLIFMNTTQFTRSIYTQSSTLNTTEATLCIIISTKKKLPGHGQFLKVL